MGNSLKVLFVHPSNATFIKNDLKILRDKYDVKVIYVNNIKFTNIAKIFNMCVEMIRSVLWADLIFIWFVDLHAILPIVLSRISSKRSIIVVGGYEVAASPEINYGSTLSPFYSKIVKFILLNADTILAVSEFSKKDIEKICNKKIKLLYNGIDNNLFKPLGKKERLVITVSVITNENISRKGLKTFIETAKHLQDIDFMIIGKYDRETFDHLTSIAPKNVKFTGYISQEELISLYQRAHVYCQLSFYESFGLALAEAMSCNCIPIVTCNGALPEVVGNTGIFVPYGDVEATVNAIRLAFSSYRGDAARQRILQLYSLSCRKRKLLKIVDLSRN